MCIYLGELDGLNYDSAEHIIPAGLGGIKELPIDYVSREFNNKSSKFEQTLMRSSIIALPRQILGPGKRGSLNLNKATKSSVNVFRQHPDNGTFSLGYIKMGKPHEIPHIALNSKTGELWISISKETTDVELQVFKKRLTEFETLRFIMIKSPDLQPNFFLLGIEQIDKKPTCFIASRDGKTHPFNPKVLSEIAKKFENKDSFLDSSSNKVESYQKVAINDDYYKCCAKIGFNCLAHLKGKEFVSQTCFNPLKNWIVNGGKNNFVVISNPHSTASQVMFPEDSHHVIITKSVFGNFIRLMKIFVAA